MKPDEKASLDPIMKRLNSIEKAQKERSFLSRLDMMFSVLVSFTLFISGLFLTTIKPVDLVTKLAFSLFASLLVLLIYTLIGESYAIVTDHEILRFTYWMILLEGIHLLTIWGAYLTLFLIPIEIAFTIVYFFGLPTLVTTMFLIWFVERLYERYIRNLYYRKPRPRSRSNWLNPLLLGFAIQIIATLVAFISKMI